MITGDLRNKIDKLWLEFWQGGISDHRQDMEDSLRQHLLSECPAGFEIRCCAWPKSKEHDRYALTDVGGIGLGEGFDERTPDGTEHVKLSLVGAKTRRRLLSSFLEEPTYRVRVGANRDGGR